MLDAITRRIASFASRGVDALNPPTVEEYFAARPCENRRDYLYGVLNVINGNTATLLTHISAMIAVLGIMLIIFQDAVYTKLFVMAEMLAYTALAVLCVFNMRMKRRLTKHTDKTPLTIYESYLRRRYIYQFCVDGVLYVTIFFFITVIVHMLGVALA